nr:hypothetical protein [Tanacetum cinerariifolium]
DSIPIANLDPTPAEKIQAWFDSSIPFFNGIVDEDRKGCEDDSVLVSKDNSVDDDYNVCEDASAGLSKDEIVNDKNNDVLLLEDVNGLFDSKACYRNSEEDNANQPANVSIRDHYIVIKVHEERIANLERLLKENLPNDYVAENTKPDMIPNHSDDIPSCSVPDLNFNQTDVDQELGGAANDPMSICSRPEMCNAKVGCDELDVLQHEAYVDRSGPKINQHPTAEPLTADEFREDYISVLNDKEMIPNVSLDDMKFQHEEENFPVKDTPLEHQLVDVLIDAQKDTTNLLPDNVKNYVLRSIQERKKRLAIALGSPYGQLGTTTPAPPKTRSMTSIEDTIMAPEFEVDSIPIANLDPTPAEKIQAWFDSSIPFFNGIVDEDRKGCEDDSVLVSKDNSVDDDYNVCEDASAGLSKDEIVNDKNNDVLLLEDVNGLFDSKACYRNSEEDNANQPANVSIRDHYIVIKVHEERIANLERLLKENLPNDYVAENTKPDMIPNHSDDIPSCSVPDLNFNQTDVDQELGGAANDPMSICSRPEMCNAKVGCDAYVDRSGPKINQHPTAEPLTADEFREDYISVLNDKEMIPNVSLDDMKFQHEEENFPVKDTPLEHQLVDVLIDAQKDTTNLLPDNVKNYVLRSIQERKKRLAIALGSPYGQLGTTTPAPPKTRSMTSIEDTIMAPEFEVILSRPNGHKKDKLACLDLAKKAGWRTL